MTYHACGDASYERRKDSSARDLLTDLILIFEFLVSLIQAFLRISGASQSGYLRLSPVLAKLNPTVRPTTSTGNYPVIGNIGNAIEDQILLVGSERPTMRRTLANQCSRPNHRTFKDLRGDAMESEKRANAHARERSVNGVVKQKDAEFVALALAVLGEMA
jgi:hypothetical protein